MLLFIMLPTAQGKVVSFFKFRFASVNKFLWFTLETFIVTFLVSAKIFLTKVKNFSYSLT